jgi:hypothetical protein
MNVLEYTFVGTESWVIHPQTSYSTDSSSKVITGLRRRLYNLEGFTLSLWDTTHECNCMLKAGDLLCKESLLALEV